MLTNYGRLRHYKDGVMFRWNVKDKMFEITDEWGNISVLRGKKIPVLERMLISVQHRPESKLKEK